MPRLIKYQTTHFQIKISLMIIKFNESNLEKNDDELVNRLKL